MMDAHEGYLTVNSDFRERIVKLRDAWLKQLEDDAVQIDDTTFAKDSRALYLIQAIRVCAKILAGMSPVDNFCVSAPPLDPVVEAERDRRAEERFKAGDMPVSDGLVDAMTFSKAVWPDEREKK